MSSLRIVDTIDSTTAELLRLPLSQAPVGTALLALRQTGGRGRSDRVWESPPGGMYLSVMLRPADPRGLSLLGALSLIGLLEEYEVKAELRWPNDVMVGGKKIGGVLPVVRYQGNSLERAVLGVGFNVAQRLADFPAELQDRLTTLAILRPSCPSPPELAEQYLRLLRSGDDRSLADICRDCQQYLEGKGEKRTPVLVQPAGEPLHLAPIEGLAHDGSLLLEGGERLESLGRDQRLRFLDEL